jgi:hypothetical protein
LFSTDVDVSLGKKSLINEYYDELIFIEPCQFFHQLLVNTKALTSGVYKHDTDCKFKLNFPSTQISMNFLDKRFSLKLNFQ